MHKISDLWDWRKVIAVALIVQMILTISAHAAPPISPQDLPSQADPGRRESFELFRSNDFTEKPAIRYRSNPPALPEDAAKIKFILNSVEIRGATAFSEDEFTSTYNQYISETITVEHLFKILSKIQELYIDKGYTVSKVRMLEQAVETGHIVFEVVEGYIESIEIDPELEEASIITGFANAVRNMRPLNTQLLERYMLLLNERPGLNVSSILSPVNSPQAPPGAIKLILQIQDQSRFRGFLNFDNYGSNYSGPGQFTAGGNLSLDRLNYSDLFVNYAQTTSTREMRQGALFYTLPLFGISGTTLELQTNISKTEPGENLDILDIKGQSQNAGFQINYPIIRQRDKAWRVSAGFNYKNVGTDILDERLFRDKIRSIMFETRYSFSDEYSGLNILKTNFSHGLDVFGARESGSLDLSRSEGRSDYSKYEIALSRIQGLPYNLNLHGSVQGQFTNKPLLSSEEFGFGGIRAGRGYDSSEITGDKGISAVLELRYNSSLPQWSWDLQPYVFYDIGKVWNIDPLTKDHFSASSTGVGLRLNLNSDWSIDGTAAYALNRTPDNPPPYASDNSRMRYLFSLKRNF